MQIKHPFISDQENSMHLSRRWSRIAALAVLTAAGLVACGGGNDPLPPKASISRVYVMGDSLADVGTFGYKFTVQGFQIWPQIVANQFGLNGAAQCNFFTYASSTFVQNSTVGCTNYAIGDGRITGNGNPQTIGTQLTTQSSNYNSTDLVLIDGGGNDAADLAGAYIDLAIASSTNQAAAFTALNAVLSQMGLSTNGTDTAEQGRLYMVALANTLTSQIITNTLSKGAAHVAVLDIPDITLTPRFSMVIGNIAASDPVAAAQIKLLIQGWISAYNSQLAQNFSNEKRVAIVPFYADFTDEITHPQAYSLSNVNDTACPAIVGSNGSPILDSNGLPTYDFPTCTPTALDAMTGKTAGWWKSYAFSDGFHPTPYGHQLLAASVSRALARAGWL
jgi:outer membrane lipase/esterase